MPKKYATAPNRGTIEIQGPNVGHVFHVHLAAMAADGSAFTDATITQTPAQVAQAIIDALKTIYPAGIGITPMVVESSVTPTAGGVYVATLGTGGAGNNGASGTTPNGYGVILSMKDTHNNPVRAEFLDSPAFMALQKYKDHTQANINALYGALVASKGVVSFDGYPIARFLSWSNNVNRRLARHLKI